MLVQNDHHYRLSEIFPLHFVSPFKTLITHSSGTNTMWFCVIFAPTSICPIYTFPMSITVNHKRLLITVTAQVFFIHTKHTHILSFDSSKSNDQNEINHRTGRWYCRNPGPQAISDKTTYLDGLIYKDDI